MADNTYSLTLISRAARYLDRVAIISRGGTISYAQLLEQSGCLASGLLNGREDLQSQRVAFLVQRHSYPIVQWGIWRAGGIAVPLCEIHPPPELDYVIQDADVSKVVTDERFLSILYPITRDRGIPLLRLDELISSPMGTLPTEIRQFEK